MPTRCRQRYCPRHFRREQIIYDPWHYLPALMEKPGALRNGAPFRALNARWGVAAAHATPPSYWIPRSRRWSPTSQERSSQSACQGSAEAVKVKPAGDATPIVEQGLWNVVKEDIEDGYTLSVALLLRWLPRSAQTGVHCGGGCLHGP